MANGKLQRCQTLLSDVQITDNSENHAGLWLLIIAIAQSNGTILLKIPTHSTALSALQNFKNPCELKKGRRQWHMYKCQRILCYKKSLKLCFCVSTVSYCVLYRTLCIMKRTLLWVTLNELWLINSSEKSFLFAVKFYSTHVKTCQEVLVYVERFWNNYTTEREGNRIIIKTKNALSKKHLFTNHSTALITTP